MIEKISPKTKYNKTHTTLFTIRANHSTDADIIEKLNSVPNKQGYIKELIRKDIANNK